MKELQSSPAPIHLIEERPNPSTDYFVRPVLQASGRPIHCYTFSRSLPDPSALTGASVVLVRYVPAAWAGFIERHRSRLGELIFFMDDDLFDLNAARGTNWRYRLKLARLATWRRDWLKAQGAALWVSTPYLRDKYADWQPQLIRPAPLPAPIVDEHVRVFYHGSASHEAEIRWLHPVIEAALQAEPRLSFEIIGTSRVNRLYRRLPRTTVVHPMSWPTYRAFIAMPGRHIGLAPLLDSPFNHARSCTKFFDITRAGAVGIYAPGPVCADMIEHDVNGWVVALDPDAWTNAILRLTRDVPLRRSLLDGARATAPRSVPWSGSTTRADPPWAYD
ncbi:glycosyltransferase family protein [Allochromatium vinosum]|uniref:glycosyltransferase family 1 protein n=1 Tax=Allochromatium vinosum TaxID=1049 RepID=UPI0002DED4D6|nr:glycosyltransferase family 1 protein [Allochromatium vinosum]